VNLILDDLETVSIGLDNIGLDDKTEKAFQVVAEVHAEEQTEANVEDNSDQSFMLKLSRDQDENVQWSQLNKRTLHKVLRENVNHNRANVIEEFQENYNEGT
jgi:hypothetical protein